MPLVRIVGARCLISRTGRQAARRGTTSHCFSSVAEDNLSNTAGAASTTGQSPKGSTNNKQTSSYSSFKPNPIPDFSYAKAAWSSKSTKELVVGGLSFSLCRVPFLVRHADALLRYSRRILGDTLTDFVLKQSLFGHFCAGEDERTIQPVIQRLEQAGIGSILDFAAENDGSQSNNTRKERARHSSNSSIASKPLEQVILTQAADNANNMEGNLHPKVRMYDYESETQCDDHVQTFLKCIQDVSNLQKDGFAAIKVTALGNPVLLERMSRAIVETQHLFARFDTNGDGLISKEEFERGYQICFRDDDVKMKEMIDQLQHDRKSNMIDYISWSMLLQPRDLPKLTAGCRDIGPLAMATPTEEEVILIERMFQRGQTLAEEAAKVGTRLLVDAEQARFQPAIDNHVLDLQRRYNSTDVSSFPVIYNTYQCYLVDSLQRLKMDVERSERFGYHFGAKLVRGAYMESERALATALGYPSPIHATIEDTHSTYNTAVEFLLRHAKTTDKQVELMVASHNQRSVEAAIAAMNEIGIDRKSPTISFAQLYGMMDHLTYNLGLHGYRVYKYVPYGPVKLVLPYLIRRANENSSVAGASALELQMIRNELSRRTFGRRST